MSSDKKIEEVEAVLNISGKDDGEMGLLVSFNIIFDGKENLTPSQKTNIAAKQAKEVFESHCKLKDVYPVNHKKPFTLSRIHVNQYTLKAFCLPNNDMSKEALENNQDMLSVSMDEVDKKIE